MYVSMFEFVFDISVTKLYIIRIFQFIKLLWLVLPYRIPSMTSLNILLSLCVPWRKHLFLTNHVVIHTYQCLQNPRGLYLYHAAPLFIQCFPVGACFLRLLYLSFNHKVVDYYQAIYRHFTLVSVRLC